MDIKSDPSNNEESNRQSSADEDSDSDDLEVSLPAEIISDILIKLPVKSLSRFKCVSKPWRVLISDPAFVKAHLQGNIQDVKSHRLIMKTLTPNYDMKSCSLSSVLNGESSTTDLNYPWEDPPLSVGIIGSVNGLVCIRMLSSDYSLYIYIWNPSTGKAKRLPQCGSGYKEIVSYGFGYDEVNSDYKVVIIYRSGIPVERSYNLEGNIYGLKSDSWRKIDDFFMRRSQLSPYSTFVSGSLNWLASGGTIVSLDLSKETCSVTELPFYLEGTVLGSNLGNLNGNLCQLSYDSGMMKIDLWMMKIDLWVMKQFGNVDSWSKMYSIPSQCGTQTFEYYASLIISKKNKVLMLIESVLMLYDLETKTVTHPDIQNLSNFLNVNTYMETLVSPHDTSNNH